MTEAYNYVPKELEEQLPPLYATEEIPLEEKQLLVKYFVPSSNWTWYGVEYDPNQELFFGYIEGLDNEWGYFSLKEFRSVRGPLGLQIERDFHFKPIAFEQLKK